MRNEFRVVESVLFDGKPTIRYNFEVAAERFVIELMLPQTRDPGPLIEYPVPILVTSNQFTTRSGVIIIV